MTETIDKIVTNEAFNLAKHQFRPVRIRMSMATYEQFQHEVFNGSHVNPIDSIVSLPVVPDHTIELGFRIEVEF